MPSGRGASTAAQLMPDRDTPALAIAVVGGTFLIGEMLADYVLAPRIIGRRVKLNPVWLMFSLVRLRIAVRAAP